MTLDEMKEKVMERGPTRVVINEEGEATTPMRALAQRVSVDVIYLRKDGWSLGAPQKLSMVARRLWDGDWVGRLHRIGADVRDPDSWEVDKLTFG
ncbi:MAG: hypothetical protein DRJ03_02070 [Chloroflexi bacterium]|nr:MAG: hypothetical protein DRJ03_02070 [Chloroflexota bacterium]